MNTITASFNAVMGKRPKCLSEKKTGKNLCCVDKKFVLRG